MQKFRTDELIPHPQNEFFFDEMEGQKWTEFLQSVKTSGIIEPPVVTSEKVIVSGHQRIRACKEIGIEEVYCEVRTYDDPDMVVKDLIETNIRQRGTIAGSELKMGRVWDELKRIYGIRNGVNQYAERVSHYGEPTTREEAAQKLGKSANTLDRYSELGKMIPELQSILEKGKITATTASNLLVKLSEEEQISLLAKLPAAQKFTQAQVQQYIDQIKGLTETNATLAQEAVEATRAVKASTDSEEYMRMQKAKDDALQEARDNYEKWQAEKKKNGDKDDRESRKADAAARKAEVDKIKADAAAQVKHAQEQMEKANKALADAQKKGVNVQEKIVEVVPEDYDELKQAKAELDLIKTSGNPDISNQILRIHTDDRTPEQKLNSFETRITDIVGGFLFEARGLEVQFDLCSKLQAVNKRLLRTNIAEIQQILVKMDSSIMEAM